MAWSQHHTHVPCTCFQSVINVETLDRSHKNSLFLQKCSAASVNVIAAAAPAPTPNRNLLLSVMFSKAEQRKYTTSSQLVGKGKVSLKINCAQQNGEVASTSTRGVVRLIMSCMLRPVTCSQAASCDDGNNERKSNFARKLPYLNGHRSVFSKTLGRICDCPHQTRQRPEHSSAWNGSSGV